MLCKDKIRKHAGMVFTPPPPHSQNYQLLLLVSLLLLLKTNLKAELDKTRKH